MSQVNETLVELVGQVTDQLQLQEDDFDKVQDIILDNFLPLDDNQLVIEYFRDIVLCPRCGSLLGLKCTCPR